MLLLPISKRWPAHGSHDCPASPAELAQRDMNVAAALALVGYTFLFDRARRQVPDSLPRLLENGFGARSTDSDLLMGREPPPPPVRPISS